MSGLAAIGSVVGGLSGMFSKKNKVPQAPQLQYYGQADTGAYNNTNELADNSSAHQLYPQYAKLVDQIMRNPAAGTASQFGMDQAVRNYGLGNDLVNTGMSLVPYATNLLDMGFDPQNAYRARAERNLTNSVRAGQAARGIEMSPYGANLEARALGDFGTTWENNLLQRAQSAGTTASDMIGKGGNLALAGGTFAGQQPGAYLAAANMPYTSGLQALGLLSGAGQNLDTNTYNAINAYLNYIGKGQGAQQLGMQGQQQQFAQNAYYGNAVGQGLQGIGNMFSGFF